MHTTCLESQLKIPYKWHVVVAKMEKHENGGEGFQMSACSIWFVQHLRMAVYEANWNAPCSNSCGKLVQNPVGNSEYDAKDVCFPNNLAGFHNEYNTWANCSLVNLNYCSPTKLSDQIMYLQFFFKCVVLWRSLFWGWYYVCFIHPHCNWRVCIHLTRILYYPDVVNDLEFCSMLSEGDTLSIKIDDAMDQLYKAGTWTD